jgi:hypothetical protein
MATLEADRRERVRREPAPAHGAAEVARIDQHVLGKLEQPAHRPELQTRERRRIARGVQIGPAHVTDKKRVAGEDEPGFLSAAPAVGDGVREVSRRMTRGRQGTDDRVSELDYGIVRERRVRELHARSFGKIGSRAGRLDERGQPGDVVGLDVRLEDGGDRRSCPLGGLEVGLDQLEVRVDDREPGVREAAEQVARASRLLVEEGSKEHGQRSG